jgi:hypothetical protein
MDNLSSGLRSGAAIGGMIKGGMDTSAVQNAAQRIQAGENQQAVISELMAQSPQAAQQLMNLLGGQQNLDAGATEIEALKTKVGMQSLQQAALPIFGALQVDDDGVRGKLLNEAAAVFEKQSPETAAVIRQIGGLQGKQQFDAVAGIVKSLRSAGVFPDDPSQLQGSMPADVSKFEYWKKMNPNATEAEAREVYNKIIDPFYRSQASAQGAANVKLMTEQRMTPVLANRAQQVKVGEGRGEQQLASEANAKKNSVAFQTYRAALGQLERAASQTATNPIAGAFPALSANAQIMEGAISTMAPLLKDVFRQAGEGTFTDKDQEILLKMVPTRSDHPEASKAKLQMIDNIISSKLQQQGAQNAGDKQPVVKKQSYEDKYMGGG